MIKRPGKSYLWPTWITGLLAGTDRCQYKAWIKAHYQNLPKQPQKPEDKQRLDEWMVKHNQMTESRSLRLRDEGYQVKIEDENAFKLEGNVATLSGKPDIVALKPQFKYALVVDEKSGRAKEQYVWQVLIYMFALGMTVYKGWKIHGEVEYLDTSVPVLPEQLTEEVMVKIGRQIQITGGPEQQPTTPSLSECRYCDVINCPDRIVEQPSPEKIDANVGKYF